MPWDASRNVIGRSRPVVGVALGGVDVSDYLLGLQIRETLGGQFSFTLRLKDYVNLQNRLPSRFNPLYTWGTGPFAGIVQPHAWTSPSYAWLSINVAGMIWTSNPYILKEPEFDGKVLEIGGIDPTGLLEEEIENIPDIIGDKDPPDVAYAHATIRQMLALKGITNVILDFPDYRIRELRRGKGRLLTWIDQITRPYQALRTWIGSTLVIAPAPALSGMSPAWKYQDMLNLEIMKPRLNEDMVTGVKVARLVPQAGQIGETPCEGPECPGIRTGTVRPSRVVRGQVLYANDGRLHSATFFQGGVGGRVLGTSLGDFNFYYQGPEECDTVQFTYEVNPRVAGGHVIGVPVNAPTQPYGFKVVWWGGTGSGGGEFDDDFNAEFNDTETEGKLGRQQRSKTAIEDSIIPNSGVAYAAARAFVLENTRKGWSAPFGTPFLNPFHRVRECIQVNDYETEQAGQKWLTEERVMEIQASNGALFGHMDGTLTKRLTD